MFGMLPLAHLKAARLRVFKMQNGGRLQRVVQRGAGGESLARFTNGKNKGSRIKKNPFSLITKTS